MNFLKLSDRIKPEIFFVIVASFFGLIILFVTPPFQSPDEINHFYRAFQISEGQFIGLKSDNRIGAFVPISLVKTAEPFLGLRWNKNAKTNLETIINQFKINLEPTKKVFIDIPNTVIYSPISYLPQSTAIFILRNLGFSPIFIFYGARLFALFFWIIVIFFSIKIIPIYKWLFALIAQLPMSVFINMSVSADVMTNILSFIFIAYIFKLAYNQPVIKIQHFLNILFLALFLSLAKMVYIPLIILFLLIPKEKFKDAGTKFLQMAILLTICLIVTFLWAFIMNDLYIPYSHYNINFRDGANLMNCADIHLQMNYILNHDYYILNVFYNSITKSFEMYSTGYIGTFGWLDGFLPLWFIILSYSVIIAISLTNGSENLDIKPIHRLLFIFIIISMFCLVLLSQHLTWDCIGDERVPTVQGRYLIPVFPLLFMLCYNKRFIATKVVIPTIILYTLLSLSITYITLYTRYYVEQTVEISNL